MAAFEFRRRRVRRWWYVGATLVAAALFMVFFVASSGAVTGSPSGFESGDGNMTLQAAGADWNCFQGTDKFATLASGTPAGCTVTSGATQTWADGGTTSVGSSEFQFKSGTKFDDACVVINSGNNPPKDEWSNIAEYTEAATATNSDGGHDLYFYGASIRPVVNGNSSGNVYFSQTSNGCHTVGDVLLTFDFLQGGGSPTLHSLRWISSGSCFVSQDSAPCWGNKQDITNAALFDGNINTAAIAATANGISGTALPINAFAEFGINLTQAIKVGNPNGTLPCFANETWVSRSSGSSFTSNPEDVETVNRPTCGSITIIKDTLNGSGTRSGINQQFSYSTTGGLSPSSFHLNDAGGATGDVNCTTGNPPAYADSTTTTPCNTITYSNVPAGSYTVTEGNVAGFTFKSLVCTQNGAGTTVSPSNSTSVKTATITLAISGSVVCTYTNQQNTASMATQVSATTSVFPGVSVHDTDTVTGNNSSLTPSGTVSFRLCSFAAGTTDVCDGSDTAHTGAALTNVSPQGDLSGTGATASADSPNVNTSTNPLTPGRYCFRASWPGDTNYPGALTEYGGASGTNECFTVTQISTTTKTTPSAGSGGTVAFGSSVTDHALIKADQSGDGVPTGSVTFFICDPTQTSGGACPDPNGTQVGSAVNTVASNPATTPPSSTADSSSTTVNKTGTWCWRAVYAPGGANGNNYTGSSDASSGECFTVTDTTTSSSAQTWYPNDSASVHASTGDTIYGTLQIQLYSDGTCGGSNHDTDVVSGQVYSTTVTQANAAASISVDSNKQTSFGVNTANQGNYSWWVTFVSGDTNVANSSHCESSNVAITN